MENILYKIAGHLIKVGFDTDWVVMEDLSNYATFEVVRSTEIPLFSCVVSDKISIDLSDAEFIADFDGDSINMKALRTSKGYVVRLYMDVDDWIADMEIFDEDSTVNIKLLRDGAAVPFAINNALMLLYTYFSAKYDTLLMHSSVVMYNGKGYMFLGKSGTGKSTQSRMWLENIPGAVLLNDDNPAVRILDNVAVVYGTPWSGKTPCYKNRSVPIGGIVRIRRAGFNKIEQLRGVKAYASLVPSSSCIKWDRGCELAHSKTVERAISIINCYQLECLPNGDAARCCCEGVAK
ncbi:MAG: hypothetical protein R3Y22_01835 [Bacteroidales bacterium]